MIYHVSINGCDRGAGTAEAPFRTINHAAQIAVAGDTVRVHSGTYREWVDPQNGGMSDFQRIVYEAAEGEHPIIKGSEVVTGWEHVSGSVWKKMLPNSMFGDWNPYALEVEGDWLIEPSTHAAHLGEVYLNGVAMYETIAGEDVFSDNVREIGGLSKYGDVARPVWIEDNAYSGYAKPSRHEKRAIMAEKSIAAEIEERNGKWVLTLTVPEAVVNADCKPVATERLGVPRLTEQPYTAPDGNAVDLTRDLLGNAHGAHIIPGPIADLTAGRHTFVVW